MGAAIRISTHHRGERHPTVTNHAFLVRYDGSGIIESTATGTRERELSDVVCRPGVWGILVEVRSFTAADHELAERAAAEYHGRTYGFAAIAKQAADGALGWVFGCDVFLFRRLRLPWTRPTAFYNICSWLLSHALAKAGWFIHGVVRRIKKVSRGYTQRLYRTTTVDALELEVINPDHIMDDVMEHRPHLYRVRVEYGPRPDNIPWRYVEKLKADKALRIGP